ncbi:MAG: 3-deoxy-7-phosphoheptulonate synthase class II [Actinomycetes bacterium]
MQQAPVYPDRAELEAVEAQLAGFPPLVFAGEARKLKRALGKVAAGEAFLLQGGDCAESFAEHSADNIRDFFRLFLQMAVVMTFAGSSPVVKLGRVAGQFAKPRSAPTETIGGVELPSYRGDIINGIEFTEQARVPDPSRQLMAYRQSAATLNLVRAFTKGGFADLTRVHAWNQEFVAATPEGQRYEALADEIERALRFMAACGIDLENELQMHQVDFWVAHEALLLEYEEALTRRDSLSGDWYDCSAHMLWIGERTRQPDGAHVEFLSGVQNPVGVKLGPDVTPSDAVDLCERLNPTRAPGRVVLFTRMGADRIGEALPPLMRAVGAARHPVVWACDPMHANTFTHASGYKTRRFDDIMRELHGFFDVCEAADVRPGGVHVELTGENVTECLGGSDSVLDHQLEERYETMCDPRLNAFQSLDLAFEVSALLRR